MHRLIPLALLLVLAFAILTPSVAEDPAHPCPACGTEMVYDTATEMWHCPACGLDEPGRTIPPAPWPPEPWT